MSSDLRFWSTEVQELSRRMGMAWVERKGDSGERGPSFSLETEVRRVSEGRGKR